MYRDHGGLPFCTGTEFCSQDRSSSVQKLSSSHRIVVHFYRCGLHLYRSLRGSISPSDILEILHSSNSDHVKPTQIVYNQLKSCTTSSNRVQLQVESCTTNSNRVKLQVESCKTNSNLVEPTQIVYNLN